MPLDILHLKADVVQLLVIHPNKLLEIMNPLLQRVHICLVAPLQYAPLGCGGLFSVTNLLGIGLLGLL